jgi:hypothetical protein
VADVNAPEVVVIGAGLAGLRAATDLVAAGASVTVVEARDRVGGRVWSHRFADGQVAERGAEFIDGNHTEVLALAAHLGLALTERPNSLDPRATLVDAAGRPVPYHLHASLTDDCEGGRCARQPTGRLSTSPCRCDRHPASAVTLAVIDASAPSSCCPDQPAFRRPTRSPPGRGAP